MAQPRVSLAGWVVLASVLRVSMGAVRRVVEVFGTLIEDVDHGDAVAKVIVL
jgi:hypothetical protein